MSFKMSDLPKESTGGGEFEFTEIGAQRITVLEKSIAPSKSSGREQLTVKFTTAVKESWVMEFYQNSESEFMMFKLRRLIESLGIDLGDAEVTLKDIEKMIVIGAEVDAILEVNDRGYGAIDYSSKDGGMGVYPAGELTDEDNDGSVIDNTPEPVLDITSEDLPFKEPAKATEKPVLDPEIAKQSEVLSEDDF